MSEFVSAYTDDASNTVVSVSEAFAKAQGLKTLKSDPAVDRVGRVRGPREGNRTSVASPASATTTNGGSAASQSKEDSK